MADVDFDEDVDLGDGGAEKEAARGSGRTKTADAAGRRLKGRGASGGTQTTMGEKSHFDTIVGAASGKGPAKCARAVLVPRCRAFARAFLTPPRCVWQRSRVGLSL